MYALTFISMCGLLYYGERVLGVHHSFYGPLYWFCFVVMILCIVGAIAR